MFFLKFDKVVSSGIDDFGNENYLIFLFYSVWNLYKLPFLFLTFSLLCPADVFFLEFFPSVSKD